MFRKNGLSYVIVHRKLLKQIHEFFCKDIFDFLETLKNYQQEMILVIAIGDGTLSLGILFSL